MTQPSPITEHPQGQAWHSRSAEDVLAQFGTSATGLSGQEAAQRLAADGPNELKEGTRTSSFRIFLGQFKSLIIWILIAAGVISGAMGEVVDAIAILAIVVLNAAIGFYQEWSASAFAVLVFAELLRSLGARSESKPVWRISLFTNVYLIVVVVISFGLQVWSQHYGTLGRFLKTSSMPLAHCLLLLALGVIPVFILEMVKVVQNARRHTCSRRRTG